MPKPLEKRLILNPTTVNIPNNGSQGNGWAYDDETDFMRFTVYSLPGQSLDAELNISVFAARNPNGEGTIRTRRNATSDEYIFQIKEYPTGGDFIVVDKSQPEKTYMRNHIRIETGRRGAVYSNEDEAHEWKYDDGTSLRVLKPGQSTMADKGDIGIFVNENGEVSARTYMEPQESTRLHNYHFQAVLRIGESELDDRY